MPEMQNDAVSTSDERQPYHKVDGKTLTQLEWRERLRMAHDVFDDFKRQAYRDKEI
jgi:hypothetical protein